MILDLDLILNFVVFGEGISHDGNQHVEKMEHEDKGGEVEKTSKDITLNIKARVET